MVTGEAVRQAGARLRGVVHRTPVFSSATFSTWAGRDVWLKAENLQKTGAFKYRGAANFMAGLTAAEGSRGVITPSSGNHGQAVALAAAARGFPCTVVVPETVSAAKVAAIEGYGARVFCWGTTSSQRIDRARELASRDGLVFIHAFDDERIIAGQGTVGLEILEQLPQVECVSVPVGGGGLLAGIALAIKERNPRVKIYGVEPRGSNAMALSLARGSLQTLDRPDTLADGLRTSRPGTLTFPLVQRYVEDILLVEEDELVSALKHLLLRCKLLVEPSGAVALAAVLSNRLPGPAGRVAAVLSGGNMEPGLLGRLLGDPG